MEKIINETAKPVIATVTPKAEKPVKETKRRAAVAKVVTKAATTVSEGERDTLDTVKLPTFVTGDFKALNNADADKAIAAIVRSGVGLKKQAHVTACGILLHYVQHGDYTKLDKLHDAISVSMSRAMANGFRLWVVEFSSLTYDKDAKRFRHARGAEKTFQLTGDPTADADSHAFNGAMNSPFYSGDFGDKVPPAYDFDAAFAKFMETAQRHLKAAEEATKASEKRRHKVTPDQITALERVAKTLHIPLKADTKAANSRAA